MCLRRDSTGYRAPESVPPEMLAPLMLEKFDMELLPDPVMFRGGEAPILLAAIVFTVKVPTVRCQLE